MVFEKQLKVGLHEGTSMLLRATTSPTIIGIIKRLGCFCDIWTLLDYSSAFTLLFLMLGYRACLIDIIL